MPEDLPVSLLLSMMFFNGRSGRAEALRYYVPVPALLRYRACATALPCLRAQRCYACAPSAYCACAPDTTSMISRVMAAWRTLFM